MSARTYTSPRFLLRAALRRMGLEVSRYRPRGREHMPTAVEEEFRALYSTYHPYSMIRWSGLYTAWRAAKYIADHRIEGAIVECGVWKGGCAAIMAEAFQAARDARDFYLYDTYEGMSAPTEHDRSMSTGQSAEALYESYEGDWSVGALDIVRKVMAQTGLSESHTHFVKGKVEETLPKTVPDKIALLRLDTDWYESTKIELELLYPKLVKGGILIVDDYGAWSGSKKAVDEYFSDKKAPFFAYDATTGNISGVKN